MRKQMPERVRVALENISPEAIAALNNALEDSISDLELLEFPKRYVNILEDNGIFLIGELLNKKWFELLAYRQFGETALVHLYTVLGAYDQLSSILSGTQQEVILAR